MSGTSKNFDGNYKNSKKEILSTRIDHLDH